MAITDEEIQRLRTTHSSDLSKRWLITVACQLAEELDRLRRENAELKNDALLDGTTEFILAAKLAKAREVLTEYAKCWCLRMDCQHGPNTYDRARAILKELSE